MEGGQFSLKVEFSSKDEQFNNSSPFKKDMTSRRRSLDGTNLSCFIIREALYIPFLSERR